ncbi:MAG: hypothetical protein QOF76_1056 [Solirubrobacteraceae bacterium]|nr:hypothetical protein [Solirubrobacteraceae bacterium]
MPHLPTCPGCGSDLVQPLRRQQHKDGEQLVELRCPECYVVMQACHSTAELAELDRRQTASRDQIVAAYERSVAESMETLAERLHEAFERDLLSADDFRLPRAA